MICFVCVCERVCVRRYGCDVNQAVTVRQGPAGKSLLCLEFSTGLPPLQTYRTHTNKHTQIRRQTQRFSVNTRHFLLVFVFLLPSPLEASMCHADWQTQRLTIPFTQQDLWPWRSTQVIGKSPAHPSVSTTWPRLNWINKYWTDRHKRWQIWFTAFPSGLIMFLTAVVPGEIF